MAGVGDKGGHPAVVFLDRELVVSLLEIKLTEEVVAGEALED